MNPSLPAGCRAISPRPRFLVTILTCRWLWAIRRSPLSWARNHWTALTSFSLVFRSGLAGRPNPPWFWRPRPHHEVLQQHRPVLPVAHLVARGVSGHFLL